MALVEQLTNALPIESVSSQGHSDPSNTDLVAFKKRCYDTVRGDVQRAINPPADGEDPHGFSRVDYSEPHLTPQAKAILETRYLLKDPNTGKVIETPVQMFARVAEKLALIELDYMIGATEKFDDARESVIVYETMYHFRQFYKAMHDGLFIPAGRTLANKGSSVPNWYVLSKGLDQEPFLLISSQHRASPQGQHGEHLQGPR